MVVKVMLLTSRVTYFDSKASNLAAHSLFRVEVYKVVLLLIKSFTASQSILGLKTEPTLNSKNSKITFKLRFEFFISQ